MFETSLLPFILGPPSMAVSLYLVLQHAFLWWTDRRDRMHMWVWWWALSSLLLVAGRLFQKTSADPAVALAAVQLQLVVGFGSLASLCALALPYGAPRRSGRVLILANLTSIFLGLTTEWLVVPSMFVRVDAVGEVFWAITPGPLLFLLPLLAVLCVPWAVFHLDRSPLLSSEERRLLGMGLLLTMAFVMNDIALVWGLYKGVQLVELLPVPAGILASQLLMRRQRARSTQLEDMVEERTRALALANTQLREALLRAGEAAQRLLTVQEASPDAMLVSHGDHTELTNAAAHDLFPGVDGTPLRTLLPSLQPLPGGPAHQEVILPSQEGARTLDVRQAFLDGGGAVLLVVRDITAQQELRARLALNERLAALGNLVAGVAHEINNPLTYVLGNAEALQELMGDVPAGLRGEWTPLLADVVDGAHRMRDIVRDLQVFSRAPARDNTPVNLVDVVKRALAMTHSQTLAMAPARVEHQGNAWVMGQEQRLVQIVVNLVNNASHATAAAGGDRAALEISTSAEEGRVMLRVRDHGVGMAPAVKARLFEPFFTTKPQGQGTGLGLSISYQLALQMGGTLSVESTQGEGTTVSLALPSCVAPSAEGGPVPDTSSPRLRLLLVDDEPLVLRTLARTLSGHDVVCCNNAQEALDAVAARADFDVVLCDVMMPAMDGPALRRELLHRHPQLAGRFVFVTGAVTGLLQLDDALKDIPMLAKPVDNTELRARVRAVAVAAGPRSA